MTVLMECVNMIWMNRRTKRNMIQENGNTKCISRIVNHIISNWTWFNTIIQFVLAPLAVKSKNLLCMMPVNNVTGCGEIIYKSFVKTDMNISCLLYTSDAADE